LYFNAAQTNSLIVKVGKVPVAVLILNREAVAESVKEDKGQDLHSRTPPHHWRYFAP